jgi:hypothetical protein
MYESAAGSFATLTIVPIHNKNFSCRVGRVKVFNRLYNFSLTVDGVDQVVGVLNVDSDGGYDAAIGTEAGASRRAALEAEVDAGLEERQ